MAVDEPNRSEVSGELGLAGLVLHRRAAVLHGPDPGAGQSSAYTEYHERILNVVDCCAPPFLQHGDDELYHDDLQHDACRDVFDPF